MSAALLVDGPSDAPWTLVLAHGAGAPMDTPFMDGVAGGLGTRGVRVLRFEFPYMARRRATGRRAAPDRMPVLEQSFDAVLGAVDARRDSGCVAIGGKSLGGRVASRLAARHASTDAVVCLGYPFHPPGRPGKLRTAHLEAVTTPTLVLQGTRDRFGTPEEVACYPLSPAVRVHWLEDGDHSFAPRVRSGRTLEQNLEEAVESVARFLNALSQAAAPGARPER